jgi:acetyltransferase-like isoleucine patch superfamily enzyme
MKARIHPSARIEEGVVIGPGTAIWDHVHVRGPGTRIGANCIVGEKTYIAHGVSIGDRVKLNTFVYVCYGVTIENGVMVAAGTIFTNDRFPRATTTDLRQLRSSMPSADTRPTLVREGATIGAGCVVGCDLEIGRFAIAGMASVITGSIPDFHLVAGNPARSVGTVCRCGQPFVRFAPGGAPATGRYACRACGLRYVVAAGRVRELLPRHGRSRSRL